MKIATNLEQSKKLAEILSIESADMYYPNRTGIDNYILSLEWKHGNKLLAQEIPAWSLSALLELMKEVDQHDISISYGAYKGCEYVETWCCSYEYQYGDKYESEYTFAETPVDACVEMIIKLNERKLI